jgi:WD40 repeat protein
MCSEPFENSVRCVALSADGFCVAVGAGRDVSILDRATGRQLSLLRGHSGAVTAVRFSRDGKWVLSSSLDGTVRVWDANDWSEARSLACAEAQTNDVSPIVESLAVVVGWMFRAIEKGVRTIDLAPDDQTVVCGTGQGEVQVWDWRQGSKVRTINGEGGAVHGVSFSADGDWVASGHANGSVCVWDVASGEKVACLLGHNDPVRAVAFSPADRLLASGSEDRTLRLWHPLLHPPLAALRRQQEMVKAVAFSPDGRRVVSASGDSTLSIFEIHADVHPARVIGHGNDITAVALTTDGAWLATGSVSTVRLWRTADGTQVTGVTTEPIRAMTFIPNSQRLVVGCWKNTVMVCDFAGQTIACRGGSKALEDIGQPLEPQRPKGVAILAGLAHPGLTCVAASPTGEFIATGLAFRGIEIWSASTGENVLSLRHPVGMLENIAFSPDGTRLASGAGGDVCLWDRASGALLGEWKGHDRNVKCVAFSPDGELVASGSDDGTLRIWHVETGIPYARLPMTCPCEKTHAVLSLSFSGDGKAVVTQSDDGAVRVWATPRGPCHECQTGYGHVYGIANARPPSQWWALDLLTETEVRSSRTWEPAAWYPHSLKKLVGLPSGMAWAGVTGGHLHLVTLEGPSYFSLAGKGASVCSFCQGSCTGPFLSWGGRAIVGALCFTSLAESGGEGTPGRVPADTVCEVCRMSLTLGRIDTPAGPICRACFEQGFEVIASAADITSWSDERLKDALSPAGTLDQRITVLTRFDEIILAATQRAPALAQELLELLVASLGFEAHQVFAQYIRFRARTVSIATGARLLPLLLNVDLSQSSRLRENVVLVAGLIAPDDERVQALLKDASQDADAQVRDKVLWSIWGVESVWAAEMARAMTSDTDPQIRALAATLLRKMKGTTS